MNTGKNVQLLANLTGGATGTQPGVNFQLGPDVLGSFEAEVIGGAASVTLEGRMDPTAPWSILAHSPSPITATSIGTITRVMPEMRAVVTTNPGTVRIWVMA